MFSLIVFVAAVYYGIHIGQPWFRYYQLMDEMRVSARLAPSLTDAVIKRRLVEKVKDLGLPADANKFNITRSGSPRSITIETEYSESVDLPLFQHTFLFRPRTEEPL
ncbi:MAG: hypothetical protein ABJD11_09140 [Gemmatimonadota bacterium]